MSVKLFCDRCGQECKKHWELRVHTDASCLRPDFTRVLCKSCAADIMSLVNPGTDASVATTGQKAMDREHLIAALKMMQVETGSLVCLGCGHEHNCGVHGCAILREAVEALSETPKWISLADQHPEPGVWVLACCGPTVCEAYTDINGYFHRIPQEHWPGEDSPYPVTHWMPLPEPPEEVRGNET